MNDMYYLFCCCIARPLLLTKQKVRKHNVNANGKQSHCMTNVEIFLAGLKSFYVISNKTPGTSNHSSSQQSNHYKKQQQLDFFQLRPCCLIHTVQISITDDKMHDFIHVHRQMFKVFL